MISQLNSATAALRVTGTLFLVTATLHFSTLPAAVMGQTNGTNNPFKECLTLEQQSELSKCIDTFSTVIDEDPEAFCQMDCVNDLLIAFSMSTCDPDLSSTVTSIIEEACEIDFNDIVITVPTNITVPAVTQLVAPITQAANGTEGSGDSGDGRIVAMPTVVMASGLLVIMTVSVFGVL